jgi:hypothetical protein
MWLPFLMVTGTELRKKLKCSAGYFPDNKYNDHRLFKNWILSLYRNNRPTFVLKQTNERPTEKILNEIQLDEGKGMIIKFDDGEHPVSYYLIGRNEGNMSLHELPDDAVRTGELDKIDFNNDDLAFICDNHKLKSASQILKSLPHLHLPDKFKNEDPNLNQYLDHAMTELQMDNEDNKRHRFDDIDFNIIDLSQFPYCAFELLISQSIPEYVIKSDASSHGLDPSFNVTEINNILKSLCTEDTGESDNRIPTKNALITSMQLGGEIWDTAWQDKKIRNRIIAAANLTDDDIKLIEKKRAITSEDRQIDVTDDPDTLNYWLLLHGASDIYQVFKLNNFNFCQKIVGCYSEKRDYLNKGDRITYVINRFYDSVDRQKKPYPEHVMQTINEVKIFYDKLVDRVNRLQNEIYDSNMSCLSDNLIRENLIYLAQIRHELKNHVIDLEAAFFEPPGLFSFDKTKAVSELSNYIRKTREQLFIDENTSYTQYAVAGMLASSQLPREISLRIGYFLERREGGRIASTSKAAYTDAKEESEKKMNQPILPNLTHKK